MCFYLKISENLRCLIFYHIFWFVLIPFIIVAKHQSLTQFQRITFPPNAPVSLFTSLLHSLIMLWTVYYNAFRIANILYYSMNCLFQLWHNKSICRYIVLLIIHSVSLFKFPHRSHVQVILCAISLICRLKYPYNCLIYFMLAIFLVILTLFLFLLLLLPAAINITLLFVACSSRKNFQC